MTPSSPTATVLKTERATIEGIQRGNYPDPMIYPGDIVTVGDSPSRRTLESVLQFIPLLSTSAILIDRTFN